MKRKTIVFDPAMNEDFASIQIRGKTIPSDFVFVHKNPIWRFFSWFFYYCLAVPILGCLGYINHHVKVVNKKYVMKQLKGTGYFIYSNHTMTDDGWNCAAYSCSPRRTYIISQGETLMVNKALQAFLMQIGAIPLPSDLHSARNFLKCLQIRLDQKAAIAIYPEGTIWPYYTHHRPTKKGAFKYPRTFNVPVVFACTTFRAPKGLFKKFKKPRVVIYLSDPIFPSRNPVEKIDEQRLSELYDDFIEKTCAIKDNYSAYDYVLGKMHKDYLDEHFDEAASSLNDALDEKKPQ
jgi:1-acyl-sn-glycerol-3-phosphate acyltransferase